VLAFTNYESTDAKIFESSTTVVQINDYIFQCG